MIERRGESTSALAVTFWDVMPPIESPRGVPKTSPDRTGESHYDIAVVWFALIQETLAAIGEGYALPRVLRPKV